MPDGCTAILRIPKGSTTEVTQTTKMKQLIRKECVM